MTIRDPHRPRGWLRHIGGLVTLNTVAGIQVAFERDAHARFRRLRSVAADYIDQRRHPTRSRMRALAVAPGGRIAWRDVASPPPPAPGAAIVHPIAVATCDLDRPMALGRTSVPLPVHFGHECVAEVISIGEGVTAVRPGDRVVVPSQISCGSCPPCRRGHTAHCASVPPLSMYGFGLTGGQWGGVISDLLAVPYADAMLVPLPEGIDPAAAASVAENVSSAYCTVAPYIPAVLARGSEARVLLLAGLHRRPPYAVSMPLYAGLIAQTLGVVEVHFVDRDPQLRSQAEQLGLHTHPPSALRGLPHAPLVVDATGTPSGLATSIRHTTPDGVCASIGSLHHASSIPTALMYFHDISLHIGMPPVRTVIPAVLDFIRDSSLHPEHVTTDLDRIDNAPNAIRRYTFGDSTKTVLVA